MNAQQAWQAILGQLQVEMSTSAYNTWVRSAELVKCEDDTFVVGVPNIFARDWLESRLTITVSRLLTAVIGRPQDVKFIVWHQDYDNVEANDVVDEAEAAEVEVTHNMARAASPTIVPRYTFDNFVVGTSNRLAHAACMAVADSPARAYNPLFLYGGVGLGKTHLLHAIGNAGIKQGLQVMYVSSEEFTNDLINAIRAHNTPAFRDRYRRIDVLLIDDIQFIAGKESTQEEFFHTFNTLHGQDKQIVISSDRPPKAMVTLEERLRSRFEWGLTADIQAPDLETRIAILRSKAERGGRPVPNEILETIARLIQSNIRELEGALTRVVAYADLSGHPLTQSLVQTALADLLPQHRSLDTDQVIRAVAEVFGLSIEQLLSRSRSHDVALPRQIAMYIMREDINASLPQIGEVLGGRDHTTVMYACDKVRDMIESDDRLRRKVLQIREQLYGTGQVLL